MLNEQNGSVLEYIKQRVIPISSELPNFKWVWFLRIAATSDNPEDLEYAFNVAYESHKEYYTEILYCSRFAEYCNDVPDGDEIYERDVKKHMNEYLSEIAYLTVSKREVDEDLYTAECILRLIGNRNRNIIIELYVSCGLSHMRSTIGKACEMTYHDILESSLKEIVAEVEPDTWNIYACYTFTLEMVRPFLSVEQEVVADARAAELTKWTEDEDYMDITGWHEKYSANNFELMFVAD